MNDIEQKVCQDILARQQVGIRKYGTTVAQNPLELKQWLQHAYEECLDQAVYLRRAMEELKIDNQERFFCERCGKRLSGGVHTCTPPAEAEKQEPVAMQMDLIVVNLVREGINKHRARELAEHFIKHTHPQPKREPLTGVIEVKEIGYHSLQLIFESQDAIKKFKATHGIKGEA